MNLIRLTSVLLFALNFSGTPKHEQTVPSVALITSSVTFTRDEDAVSIPWVSDRRLGWDDFQCDPKRNTDAVASTSTSLGIAYQVRDDVFTYQVTCNFSKIKSWGLMRNDYILAHEQGHFDVTEIFARKLHKELSLYVFNPRSYRRDINDIYQRIVEEKEAYQHAYDGHTDHSRKKKIQHEWLLKIEEDLAALEDFADYP